MFRSLRTLLKGPKKSATTTRFFRNIPMGFEALEDRSVPAYAPGNLIILQAGTGIDSTGGTTPVFQTTGQLYLNEVTTNGALVQQTAIPNNLPVGGAGNQPIAIDLSASPGNGQLTRSYDGSVLVFGGLDAGLNSPIKATKRRRPPPPIASSPWPAIIRRPRIS